MTLLAGILMNAGIGTVTLSGEAISASGANPVDCLLIFRADGTLDKDEDGSVTQIDAATDWIIPNGKASQIWEVKYDLNSGTDFTVGDSADGVWIALSEERSWRLRSTTGTVVNNVTFSIRIGSNIIDTGVFTFSSEVV